MSILDRFDNAHEYADHIYKDNMSQKEACLDYLTRYGSITPIEALTAFNSFRLSAIIFELRKDGYVIKTDLNDGKKKYAIYTLMKEGEEYDG